MCEQDGCSGEVIYLGFEDEEGYLHTCLTCKSEFHSDEVIQLDVSAD